jgi:hypothetical protein
MGDLASRTLAGVPAGGAAFAKGDRVDHRKVLMRLDARQTPRLPVNAPAQLAFGAGRLDVLAEDLALGGCGLVAPLALRRGQPVYLTMRIPGAPAFETHATVAWASSATPHRAGVEFGPDLSQDRERSVRAVLLALASPLRPLAALHPGTWLRAVRAADGAQLTRAEREVLAALLEGATVVELLQRAPGPGTRRALLLLRARGLVAEGLAPFRLASPARRRSAPAAPELVPPFPRPPLRSHRAVASLEMARGERAAGHLLTALEWLQLAAEAAPDDPEIGAELDALGLFFAC